MILSDLGASENWWVANCVISYKPWVEILLSQMVDMISFDLALKSLRKWLSFSEN